MPAPQFKRSFLLKSFIFLKLLLLNPLRLVFIVKDIILKKLIKIFKFHELYVTICGFKSKKFLYPLEINAKKIKFINFHSSDYAKKGFVMILTVFLRAPLIVFGLVAAWLLNNILIGEILSAINIEAAFMQEGDFSIKSMIDLIVVFGVQVLMLYLLYSIIFSIIEGFYDISQKWLFGNTSASPFGDKNRSGEIGAIKDNARQFKPTRKRTGGNISFRKR